MSTRDIDINIDFDNDVLYVIKNNIDRANTMNIALTADFVARIDRKTRKVVGFTVEDFSGFFPDLKDRKEYELMEDFEIALEVLNAAQLGNALAIKY